MPSYDHVCTNDDCLDEFEDFYSMTAELPKCPKCGSDVRRLISGGSGRGIVQLEGGDLIAKVKADGKQLAREASKSESKMADMIGAGRMNNIATRNR